ERDDRREEADQKPAPGDCDRAATLERDVVRGQTTREDRDDREGDSEVLEPSHRPEELLRVSQPVERPLVLGELRRAGRRCFSAHTHPPLSGSPAAPGAYGVVNECVSKADAPASVHGRRRAAAGTYRIGREGLRVGSSFRGLSTPLTKMPSFSPSERGKPGVTPRPDGGSIRCCPSLRR